MGSCQVVVIPILSDDRQAVVDSGGGDEGIRELYRPLYAC